MRTQLVAVIVALVVSRLVFAYFHFHYSLFTDPFDIVKLTIDFGTWTVTYLIVTAIVHKIQTMRAS